MEEFEFFLIELTLQEEARELYEDGRFSEACELILGVILEGGVLWVSEMHRGSIRVLRRSDYFCRVHELFPAE